jgi:hypothetical protein
VGWFGASEVATRSLSAVTGVAAVLFGGLLARRLAGPRAGLAAAALLTCSPFCIYYAREVRGYTIVVPGRGLQRRRPRLVHRSGSRRQEPRALSGWQAGAWSRHRVVNT